MGEDGIIEYEKEKEEWKDFEVGTGRTFLDT